MKKEHPFAFPYSITFLVLTTIQQLWNITCAYNRSRAVIISIGAPRAVFAVAAAMNRAALLEVVLPLPFHSDEVLSCGMA